MAEEYHVHSIYFHPTTDGIGSHDRCLEEHLNAMSKGGWVVRDIHVDSTLAHTRVVHARYIATEEDVMEEQQRRLETERMMRENAQAQADAMQALFAKMRSG